MPCLLTKHTPTLIECLMHTLSRIAYLAIRKAIAAATVPDKLVMIVP